MSSNTQQNASNAESLSSIMSIFKTENVSEAGNQQKWLPGGRVPLRATNKAAQYKMTDATKISPRKEKNF
jgi:hypothetical protein